MEKYSVEYRDSRGRWHRKRGGHDLAAPAIAAARSLGADGWRVLDAAGNVVADHLRDGTYR